MEKILVVVVWFILLGLVIVPVSWLLTTFLNNLGLGVSFWDALPGGLLITLLLPSSNILKTKS